MNTFLMSVESEAWHVSVWHTVRVLESSSKVLSREV